MNGQLHSGLRRIALVLFIPVLVGLGSAETNAQITILEPREGNIFQRGDNITIRWECRGATMATEWNVDMLTGEMRHLFGEIIDWHDDWARVRRTLDGDRLTCTIHHVHLGSWYIPGNPYSIEIRGSGDLIASLGEEQRENSGNFIISEGRWIDVNVSPDPSPAAWVTQKYTVSWTSHNSTAPVTLKITVPSFGRPSEEVLASGLPIAGSFEWTAVQSRLIGPDLPDPDRRYFILDNGEVQARSRAFTVLNPGIMVLQPAPDVRWRADREQTITWNADFLDSDVRIKLMREEEGRLVDYQTITERTANDREHRFVLFPHEFGVGSLRGDMRNLRVVIESADRPPPFRQPARGESGLFTLTEAEL